MPIISGPTTTPLSLNNPSTKKTALLTVTSTGSVEVSGGDAVNLSGGPW
jgi:hypothetical protein